MKKIILLLLLLTFSAQAQYESGLRREQVRNVDIALQTDSLQIFRLPANILITRVLTFIDTTTANLNVVTVALSEENHTLLTWTSGETDIIHSLHIVRPDYIAAGGNVVLRYTSTGDAATGRIRVWIEYIEVY